MAQVNQFIIFRGHAHVLCFSKQVSSTYNSPCIRIPFFKTLYSYLLQDVYVNRIESFSLTQSMALGAGLMLLLAFSSVQVEANPIERRQVAASDVDDYLKQVNTALYVITNINNASALCNDPSTITTLDSEGLDGHDAHELLYVLSAYRSLSANLLTLRQVRNGGTDRDMAKYYPSRNRLKRHG